MMRAMAVVGRPLTPVSYAGVARRTTRRVAYTGAAVATTAAVGTAAVVGTAVVRIMRMTELATSMSKRFQLNGALQMVVMIFVGGTP